MRPGPSEEPKLGRKPPRFCRGHVWLVALGKPQGKRKTEYGNAAKTKMVPKKNYKTHNYRGYIEQSEGPIMGKGNPIEFLRLREQSNKCTKPQK